MTPRINPRAVGLVWSLQRDLREALRKRARERKAVAKVNAMVACAVSANLKGPSK